MRRRFILYVHEKASDSSGMDLMMQRITDHHIIEVVIDINAFEESRSEIEDALKEYIPDVIICEGMAAFFVHPLSGYNRICINPEIHPSLRCDKALVDMYRDIERTQLSYDREQDFNDDTHCWGIFGIDVERRDFMLLYYPNLTTIPHVVKSVTDAINQCVEIVQMMLESNKVDDYGVHFSNYGRMIVKVDYALFRGVKKYVISDGVVAISDGAFCGTGLESVTFPDSVSYIGKCCFRDCQQLKEIILPPRLSTIQSGCFLNCTSLNRVVLPKTLTTIRAKAFWGCDLNSIEIPNSILTISPKAFDDGVKMIVGASKLTELLQTAKDYQLSIDEGG
jgi:hypothetical protein